MKEKTTISIFVLMTSVWLGISGCFVGTNTNDLVFRAALESLSSLAQTQPGNHTSPTQSIEDLEAGLKTLSLLGEDSEFNVTPGAASEVDLDRGLADCFQPPMSSGARTSLARILKNSLKNISALDIWIDLSDSLLAVAPHAGEVYGQRGGRSQDGPSETKVPDIWITTLATECLNDESSSLWLIAALKLATTTIDPLQSSSWAAHILALPSFADRRMAVVPAQFDSADATLMGSSIGALLAGLVVLGLVMIGKPTAMRPYVSPGRHCALLVSWDYPFEGSKAFPIDDKSSSVTIGSGTFDTIYSPELIAGHIRIGAGQDVLTLTCYGPVRLRNGTVLDPAAKTPLVERFRSDRAVSFVAGDSGFVLEQVSRA